MTDVPDAAQIYAPMPPLGTMRECADCHFMVTLRQVRTGWHHWTADRDPLDGRWHCDGGHPAINRFTSAVMTLHSPLVAAHLEPYALRYDAEGVAHYPQTR